MGKWLAGAAVVLLVILILLWRSLDTSSATPAPAAKPDVAAPAPAMPSTPGKQVAAAVEAAPAAAPAAPAQPGKMDPQSDEFFFKHDEMVVPRISREAVKCIEGRTEKMDDRHKNVVIKFKQKVRDGKVVLTDVEVERSTITDQALQACFLQQVRNTAWTDGAMPDWDQDDQVTLGWRQLKKYTRANIEYEGAEAPPMMPKPAGH